ncbi:HAD family hydrolase [Streptantibioticus cattleyicolor]|uniref:HAD-superfamily hydrolase n=1 Tax=Streptantibioticus cattleyicolor (strain ATCC 35852 / DSM 46488 / JCM 4925 / NBRC 14057 / NRRL 8057) TaxID=1003195 RepID=F8JNP5_STREN|nr:HAD family phosphatase [Streptantibioticus cattleyicolor]AEW98985.1 HAD-superfamily hydrolase [Streptantibioticus cattleyicolor NRRL 8057 = DSM 46488]CCB71972.1 HAD-superfamily hydrolase [Streptantibioticus cattleyicolor NRRL 8057 = DSM 46488]
MTAERILESTPAAVVFDCDGTLMDTERHWEDARELVLRSYGFEADAEFAERSRGLHYADCGRLMAEASGHPELAAEMTGRLLEMFRKLVADDPVTMPGAVEFVHRTAEFAPLAVASNCPRDVVDSSLAHAGLRQLFRHIVVPEGDMAPKPRPDVYLTAARLLGAEPAECLAVEDSDCGVRAAVAAGLRVLRVGPRPPTEDSGDADLWVPSLDHSKLLAWADSRPSRRTLRHPAPTPGPATYRATG